MLQRESHSDSQLKPWWVDRSVVACVARTLMPSLDDCVSGGQHIPHHGKDRDSTQSGVPSRTSANASLEIEDAAALVTAETPLNQGHSTSAYDGGRLTRVVPCDHS